MKLRAKRAVVRTGVPAPRPAPATPPTLPLAQAWSEAARLFSNRSGMRIRRSWLTGLGERAGAGRIALMEKRPAAVRVAALLPQLSDQDMRVFHVRAAANLEQAVAATRLSLVVNVSVPVGLVLFVNELLPGGIIGFLGLDMAEIVGAIVGACLGLFALMVSVWYCYSGVQQARDLHYLSQVEMARRGMATLQPAAHDPTEARL